MNSRGFLVQGLMIHSAAESFQFAANLCDNDELVPKERCNLSGEAALY